MTSLPNAGLTASEQVFLQGEKFAGKGGLLNKYRLMHNGIEVSQSELVTNMVAAAFLASEKAGATRLELRQKKALLGLTKTTSIYAEPLQAADFPAGSLEAQIYELAVEFKRMKDQNEIWKLVYAWLRQDVGAPWSKAVEFIQVGLGQRQFVDVVQEKKLKIFTTTRYELPETTRLLAASLPVEPVQQLLAECRQNRPEVWALLVKQIKQGIDNRTERDDSD